MSYRTLRSDYLERGTGSKRKFRGKRWNQSRFKFSENRNTNVKRENSGILKVTIENNRRGIFNRRRRKPNYQYQKYLKSIRKNEEDKPVILCSTNAGETRHKISVLPSGSRNSGKELRLNSERTVTRESDRPSSSLNNATQYEGEQMEVDNEIINLCSEEENTVDTFQEVFTNNINSSSRSLDKKFTTIMQNNVRVTQNVNSRSKRGGHARNFHGRTVYADHFDSSRQRNY